jgi:HlyD family secretion protein
MKETGFTHCSRPISLILIAICIVVTSCRRSDDHVVQGYMEGEFVYVASPTSGALQALSVVRGAQVREGAPLFDLENGYEKAGRDEARRRVAQAQANLDDAKTGQRPTELESIQAQIDQARVASVLSQKDFERQDALAKSGAVSKQDLDRARSARDQDQKHLASSNRPWKRPTSVRAKNKSSPRKPR